VTVEVAGLPEGGAASTLQPDGVPVPGEGELPKMNWLPPAMPPPPVAFCPVGGGAKAVEEQQAAIAEAAELERQRAIEAEQAERARNCGAPLFADGACPTDEEIEREQNLESYCGRYDPSRVQPDGTYAPKPGC
jgi:hypothetical protein